MHSADPRPIVYTRDQLEGGMTHDDLWNAAQLQMVQEGKMQVSFCYDTLVFIFKFKTVNLLNLLLQSFK